MSENTPKSDNPESNVILLSDYRRPAPKAYPRTNIPVSPIAHGFVGPHPLCNKIPDLKEMAPNLVFDHVVVDKILRLREELSALMPIFGIGSVTIEARENNIDDGDDEGISMIRTAADIYTMRTAADYDEKLEIQSLIEALDQYEKTTIGPRVISGDSASYQFENRNLISRIETHIPLEYFIRLTDFSLEIAKDFAFVLPRRGFHQVRENLGLLTRIVKIRAAYRRLYAMFDVKKIAIPLRHDDSSHLREEVDNLIRWYGGRDKTPYGDQVKPVQFEPEKHGMKIINDRRAPTSTSRNT